MYTIDTLVAKGYCSLSAAACFQRAALTGEAFTLHLCGRGQTLVISALQTFLVMQDSPIMSIYSGSVHADRTCARAGLKTIQYRNYPSSGFVRLHLLFTLPKQSADRGECFWQPTSLPAGRLFHPVTHRKHARESISCNHCSWTDCLYMYKRNLAYYAYNKSVMCYAYI